MRMSCGIVFFIGEGYMDRKQQLVNLLSRKTSYTECQANRAQVLLEQQTRTRSPLLRVSTIASKL
jgi:hypothetical protein